MNNLRPVAIVLASVVLCGVGGREPAARPARKPVVITISRDLFCGVPDKVALATLTPFRSLLVAGTDVTCELGVAADGAELADRLRRGKTDIGLFDGVEFAWACHDDPKLIPLMVTVNTQDCLKAEIVVRKADDLDGFVDLKNQSLAVPVHSRRHCHVFLEHLCKEHEAKDRDQYFGRVTKPKLAEDALDDVVDGKTTAALVDNVALACFRRRKPARADRLTVLVESSEFPNAVVACRQGRFNAETRGKIQHALDILDGSATGRQVLMLWNLKDFDHPPRDFKDLLEKTNREYPATASDRRGEQK